MDEYGPPLFMKYTVRLEQAWDVCSLEAHHLFSGLFLSLKELILLQGPQQTGINGKKNA